MARKLTELSIDDARRYNAVAAALWSVLAAGLALLTAGYLALPADPMAAVLGVGRLAMATRFIALMGVITPALAGALLGMGDGDSAADGVADGGFADEASTDEAPNQDGQLGWALAIWHGGVVLGVLDILAGGMSADPWLPASLVSRLVLVAAGILITLGVWRAAARSGDHLPVVAWFGVAASAGLVAYLTVGLLAVGLGGSGQAVASAIAGRGLLQLWAALAGLGVASAILPVAVGRPLYGRRPALLGLVGWTALIPLAAARDVSPGLLPGWLPPIVESACLLTIVPALLIGVAVLGTLIGSPRARPPAVALFATAGVLFLIAGTILEASSCLSSSRGYLQFTAWDPATSLLPLWPGLTLLAIAAGYFTLQEHGLAAGEVPLHRHLWLAAGATALGWFLAWPLGLAEASIGAETWLAGGAASTVAIAFRLRLVPVLLALFSAGAWLVNSWPAVGSESRRRVAWPAGSPAASSVSALLALSTVSLGLGLMLTLFAPLADPGATSTAARSLARDLDGQRLRSEGRTVYVAEGCIACHTQRARDFTADLPYGPPIRRSEYGDAAALAGHRRLGPDLTWVGDRYPTRDEMTDRMMVHGPAGSPAYPWLFDEAGATPAGQLLVDYLVGLKSGGLGR